jgi:ubiquinol-cytochrome c reductase cytochrome c subunit
VRPATLLGGGGLFVVCATIGLFATQVSADDPQSEAEMPASVMPASSGGSVEHGEELFLTSCASCHGEGGVGTDQAPDLRGVGAAAADFQLSTGRMPDTNPDREPTSKPPAFSDEQIDDLVAYVASLGPGPAIPDVENPPGDLAEGGNLFRLNCAACHSAAGNGGALSLGRDAPDLHGATGVQIAEAMRTGPASMPVFGPDTFTDQQVNSIVRYVEYLRAPDDPGGLSLGLVGPITEGVVAILIGLGILIVITRFIEPRDLQELPVEEEEAEEARM